MIMSLYNDILKDLRKTGMLDLKEYGKLSRKEIAQKINCLPKEIELIETGKPCSSNYGGKYKSFLKKNKKV
jgi:hypothetical protein